MVGGNVCGGGDGNVDGGVFLGVEVVIVFVLIYIGLRLTYKYFAYSPSI